MTSMADKLLFKRGRDWVVVSSFLTIGILIGEPAPEALRTLLVETAGDDIFADASLITGYNRR
jgi:hypothetical protein